eukprot:134542-Rhodomonas_salina.1
MQNETKIEAVCPGFPFDYRLHWHLAALGDFARDARAARVAALALELLNNIHALNNLSEHYVLAVKPRRGDGGDKELGAVGARARIGHGQLTRLGVLNLEVFVREGAAVDGGAASAILVGEVAALEHEVRDDAVEGAACVASPQGSELCLMFQDQGKNLRKKRRGSDSQGNSLISTCAQRIREKISESLLSSHPRRFNCRLENKWGFGQAGQRTFVAADLGLTRAELPEVLRRLRTRKSCQEL